MISMRDRSIKSKIIIMNMVITLIIVSIALVIFVTSEISRQKTVLYNNIKLDTKIIKEAIYASLDFNYKRDTEAVLLTMAIKPYFVDCIVFDKENKYFASYGKKKFKIKSFKFTGDMNYYIDKNKAYYRNEILDRRKNKLGSIITIISTMIYKDRISSIFSKVVLLVFIVFILSFILSSIMQRYISGPILELAKITKDIRDREDLTIEVTHKNKDAIGILYNNFNEMIKALRKKEIERKKAEKEQEKLQLQLQQSQKMEAIGQLAGGIAHDFNNILTAINGYADLALVKVKEDKNLSKMIRTIRESGRRAADLTKQLLTFSRKQIIEVKTVNLNKILSGMQDMLRRLIEESTGLSFEYMDECFIDADKSQIEQIVLNLIVNARDAVIANKHINIKKQIMLQTMIVNVNIDNNERNELRDLTTGKYALLAISDSGIGMNIETKKKIFEPFFTTKPRDKGTGLGLATVYGIVKQNKGTIYVYSELNEGTTFKIYWPLSRSKSEATDTFQKIKSGNIIGGNEKILIVEDSKEVLGFALNTLSLMGYEVFTADCGEKALKIAEKHNYNFDLILSDVIMPGMSGPEFIDTFRQFNKNTKVLFTSGYTFNLIVQDGIVKKDTNFISKPYNTTDLSIKIRELIDNNKI